MLVVYAMADSEPRQYAAQFVDVFRAAGIQTISREEPISVAVDVGLMIGVVEFNKPSDDAKRFMELLSSLGLEAHYTWWGKQGMPDQSTVDEVMVTENGHHKGQSLASSCCPRG